MPTSPCSQVTVRANRLCRRLLSAILTSPCLPLLQTGPTDVIGSPSHYSMLGNGAGSPLRRQSPRRAKQAALASGSGAALAASLASGVSPAASPRSARLAKGRSPVVSRKILAADAMLASNEGLGRGEGEGEGDDSDAAAATTVVGINSSAEDFFTSVPPEMLASQGSYMFSLDQSEGISDFFDICFDD